MKKNSVLYIIILTSLLLVSFSGCKKYLDKKPNNRLTTPSTVPDLQALLDNASEMNLLRTPAYMETSADNYFFLQSAFPSLSINNQNIYKWIPIEYNFGSHWNTCYLPVYYANICLEYVEKIPKTDINKTAWDKVKGSALFYRSYYFLMLAWTHAKAYDETSANSDLGIPLRLTADPNVPDTRATVKETYERIISDAKKAITYLPDLGEHVIRPSKAAAYGLLARAYLSMRQYDSALVYSNLCLQIKSQLLDIKPPFNAGASAPFKKYDNIETIFYTEMVGSLNLYNSSNSLIDTSLYAQYAAEDIRKTAFFSNGTGGYKRFKGNYTASASTYFSGIATDEMFLTRAECYARKGDKTLALSDLNTLLAKRYNSSFIPVVAIDATDALNRILLERRKELLLRGLRWIDIKRLNKENANILLTRLINGVTYTLQPNANYYALPLPTDIIKLTGMPQNPS